MDIKQIKKICSNCKLKKALQRGKTVCADTECEYEYGNEYDLDLNWGPRQDLCEVILT